MILTEQDKPTYFPLVNQSGPALVGAIAAAQSIAETAALRPLDLTEFVETVDVPPSRRFYLKYAPLDRSKPITVEKGFGLNRFSDEYVIADIDDYLIDDDGLLTVRNPAIHCLRLRYWSGLHESIPAKTAVAAILYYQTLRA